MSLATNTVSCFRLSGRLILIIFKKIPTKNPSLNNHKFSVSYFFKWKGCSMKKGASSPCNSNYHASAFLYHTLVCSINTLCILTNLSQYKRDVRTQGLGFNKINSFYCFFKDILTQNWHLFYCACLALKNTRITSTVWCHAINSC